MIVSGHRSDVVRRHSGLHLGVALVAFGVVLLLIQVQAAETQVSPIEILPPEVSEIGPLITREGPGGRFSAAAGPLADFPRFGLFLSDPVRADFMDGLIIGIPEATSRFEGFFFNVSAFTRDGQSRSLMHIDNLGGLTTVSFFEREKAIMRMDSSSLAYHGEQLLVNSLTIMGGADLSEPFVISRDSPMQALEPGSLVVIDENNPGYLKRSERAYDTRVAGIISGAGGVSTGIELRQKGVTQDGQNVALAGRVYALADASVGPITPGDLLTTSGTPGHAMKVTRHDRAPGAIIGKAMTALPSGRGLVLVLVSLQ